MSTSLSPVPERGRPLPPSAKAFALTGASARRPAGVRRDAGGALAHDVTTFADFASQNLTIRFRVPGADAAFSISIESAEAAPDDRRQADRRVIEMNAAEVSADEFALIARALIEQWTRRFPDPQVPAAGVLPKWRLKRVIAYIDEHICEPIPVARLAAAAGFSKMYFTTQFHAATGRQPHEFILRKRVERAQQLLLESAESLVNVALSAGFQTQAHFSTVFKRFTGCTPREWRDAHRPTLRERECAPSIGFGEVL
jgi:AraC-like DNA-binding protein